MADFELIQFDLDGTLIDSVPQLAEAINDMLATLGHAGQPVEAVRCWVGNGADMLVQRALTAAQGEAPDADLHRRARALFDEAYAGHADAALVFYPGVLDTLERLRTAGKRLALVTNKPYRFVPGILAAGGLTDHFELALGGDSLAEKKPSAAPLLHICERLDVSPARSLMVGDSENDVLAARAAGMAVAALSYGYNYGRPIADSSPDWVLDDFAGLAAILKI
ncbi:phosphoglycolate phosphatase [Oceanimonas sp. GK1]|uniref:phosphoglycolate phosphatase n=1 Tax=Oceanimonas sp. (strain GK1 / IBRC-M 10197) TaxID=511062 RepID=UPI00024951C6|nr:phosphoglycolate phosphatase [Oceanimonas sp. GK1]AEY02735.1 phosphoglycolate phosphatase [Oceanimonas sp. GK1]